MIVVDASALAEFLLAGTPRGARIATRLQRPNETLHAPHLIDLEVASTMRSLEARGLATTLANRTIAALVTVPMRRYPHDLLVPRIWQLRNNLTPYDASYVALAESLGAPLVTCDARIASSPGHRAMIEVFA